MCLKMFYLVCCCFVGKVTIKVLLMLISPYWMTYGLDLFVLENSMWTGLVLILSWELFFNCFYDMIGWWVHTKWWIHTKVILLQSGQWRWKFLSLAFPFYDWLQIEKWDALNYTSSTIYRWQCLMKGRQLIWIARMDV